MIKNLFYLFNRSDTVGVLLSFRHCLNYINFYHSSLIRLESITYVIQPQFNNYATAFFSRISLQLSVNFSRSKSWLVATKLLLNFVPIVLNGLINSLYHFHPHWITAKWVCFSDFCFFHTKWLRFVNKKFFSKCHPISSLRGVCQM